MAQNPLKGAKLLNKHYVGSTELGVSPRLGERTLTQFGILNPQQVARLCHSRQQS